MVDEFLVVIGKSNEFSNILSGFWGRPELDSIKFCRVHFYSSGGYNVSKVFCSLFFEFAFFWLQIQVVFL
jgi:hypothetical protein